MRVPSIFIGHGSPMNALAVDPHGTIWKELGDRLPRPKAILAISAHWYINGLALTANENPPTIHDFGNFPKALFDKQYPAPGSPELVKRVQELLPEAKSDLTWGIDHGTWSVLVHMYPDADIPVVQLSLDQRQPSQWHYDLGKKLAPLRDEGVLIFGSGNIVHNFGELTIGLPPSPKPAKDWAKDWVDYVKANLAFRSDTEEHPLVAWESHPLGLKANPSPDHYLPLLYVLGSANDTEPIDTLNDLYDAGTLAMLIVQVGAQ